MATFWERAAHSVYFIFSLYFDLLLLVISHFDFEGRTLVPIASVPGHCLSFTVYKNTIQSVGDKFWKTIIEFYNTDTHVGIA